MKYIALIYAAESTEPPPDFGTKEFAEFMAPWDAVNKAFEDGGVMLGGDALQPSATATTLRVRNDKIETIDGPFVETKEQLGGYYLLDCKDLDEAIKYAAMIPSAKDGAVEVRPLAGFDG